MAACSEPWSRTSIHSTGKTVLTGQAAWILFPPEIRCLFQCIVLYFLEVALKRNSQILVFSSILHKKAMHRCSLGTHSDQKTWIFHQSCLLFVQLQVSCRNSVTSLSSHSVLTEWNQLGPWIPLLESASCGFLYCIWDGLCSLKLYQEKLNFVSG